MSCEISDTQTDACLFECQTLTPDAADGRETDRHRDGQRDIERVKREKIQTDEKGERMKLGRVKNSKRLDEKVGRESGVKEKETRI